ncbi:MAG: Rrf2 family transcriptional regulator [candidate division Zixibacteria bacterium]|nr:Rrf2 family transcriptional regulator [candidate division Zixibacteria bacterium]
MKMSRKSDYALRAIWHLTNLPKRKLASINIISDGQSIPREFLAKILKDLTRAGILVSFQGAQGGYRLAKPPREITFLDVIEAIDGPVHLSPCTEEDNNCECYDNYEFSDFWEIQERNLRKALNKQHFGKFRRKKQK